MINIIEKKRLGGDSVKQRKMRLTRVTSIGIRNSTVLSFCDGICAMLAYAHCGTPCLILQGDFKQNSSQMVSKPLFLFPMLSQPFPVEAHTSYFLTVPTPHDPAPSVAGMMHTTR